MYDSLINNYSGWVKVNDFMLFINQIWPHPYNVNIQC